MHSFDYKRIESQGEATGSFKGSHGTVKPEAIRFLAGGTTLIDLMKLDVETPEVVVDINHLPLKEVKSTDAGLLVGALVNNSDLAHHELVTKNFPVLSPGNPRRSLDPVEKQSDDLGQLDAENSLCLLPRYGQCHVTSANRNRAARPSKATIEISRFWE